MFSLSNCSICTPWSHLTRYTYWTKPNYGMTSLSITRCMHVYQSGSDGNQSNILWQSLHQSVPYRAPPNYLSLPPSGTLFFKKVGCHDSPLLPILSQSHEVFVTHSRPFCDVCHPLRSTYFPLHYHLVDVVTSDHVTKVGHFSFLYCWNYVNCSSAIFRTSSFVFLPSMILSSSSDMLTFQTTLQFCHVSGGYCPRFTSVRIKGSNTLIYAFIIIFLVFILMCRAIIVTSV